MKVLIVDDELLIAEGIKHEVEALFSDAAVDAVTDAADALKLAEDKEYDVALLDVDMPRMDGLTLAKRLIALRPAINIIFVTSYQEYALEAHELYCSGFLLKPVGDMSEESFAQHYQGGDVLGKKIKMYREQRGISRQELADLMNVTRQTIHRWEHGDRIPDVLTFMKLSRLLGVDIHDIIEVDAE